MLVLEGRVKIDNQAKSSYDLEQSCLVPKLYPIHIGSMGCDNFITFGIKRQTKDCPYMSKGIKTYVSERIYRISINVNALY